MTTPEDAAAALGIAYHEDGRGPEGRHVAIDDGISYHVLELGEPRDGARPVVLLHGGGPGCTGWTDFGQVAPRFAAERPTVLVDLLQYGRSAKPAIKGPMWDFHARHLAALLDALELARADLVCNSWGGAQALCLAATNPDMIGSLVITGSMPVLYGPLAPLPERAARGRNARQRYYGGKGPTRDKMRDLMTTLEWFDGEAIPEATLDVRYRQSLEADEISCGQVPENRGEWQDLTEELRRVSAPTLFLWGMYDAFLSPEYPLMLANMVEHGNLFVMDRVSHHPQEERPEQYHAVASSFLDAWSSA